MRRIPLLHSLWFAIPATLLVYAGSDWLDHLTRTRWGDALTVVYFAGYGLYCLQNYLHCREVHCLVTGPGFLLAGGLTHVQGIGLFAYGLDVPYLVFGTAACVGCLLEWQYWRQTGSHFLMA
ncbi:MAG TPA: hypothetical protein VF807_00340 [Ktedonobacterales bacterium]